MLPRSPSHANPSVSSVFTRIFSPLDQLDPPPRSSVERLAASVGSATRSTTVGVRIGSAGGWRCIPLDFASAPRTRAGQLENLVSTRFPAPIGVFPSRFVPLCRGIGLGRIGHKINHRGGIGSTRPGRSTGSAGGRGAHRLADLHRPGRLTTEARPGGRGPAWRPRLGLPTGSAWRSVEGWRRSRPGLATGSASVEGRGSPAPPARPRSRPGRSRAGDGSRVEGSTGPASTGRGIGWRSRLGRLTGSASVEDWRRVEAHRLGLAVEGRDAGPGRGPVGRGSRGSTGSAWRVEARSVEGSTGSAGPSRAAGGGSSGPGPRPGRGLGGSRPWRRSRPWTGSRQGQFGNNCSQTVQEMKTAGLTLK
jgi:hypothetical protein